MARVVVCVAVVLLLVGCAESGPGLVPVTGKITYGGGDWPKPGYINFNPIEPAQGYPALNGSAELRTDGTFEVTSTGNKKGLVPGKYSISLECWDEMPNPEATPPSVGKSYVPDGFTPPTLEISVGEASKQLTFDVPK